MIVRTSQVMLMRALLQLLKQRRRLNTLPTWTCRLASRSGAKRRVLSCLRVRVAEARFSLLGHQVTSPSWTGSTGSLGCAQQGQTGLSLHADATDSFALVNTHTLSSMCTNQSCMTHSYLAYLPLAGDKVQPGPPHYLSIIARHVN